MEAEGRGEGERDEEVVIEREVSFAPLSSCLVEEAQVTDCCCVVVWLYHESGHG